ncbi:hypothetical protein C0992_010514, partial [Termitomyces sp. T32_za158]
MWELACAQTLRSNEVSVPEADPVPAAVPPLGSGSVYPGSQRRSRVHGGRVHQGCDQGVAASPGSSDPQVVPREQP